MHPALRKITRARDEAGTLEHHGGGERGAFHQASLSAPVKSHVQTAPLCPLYVPMRSPSSEYQIFGVWSFAQVTSKSPSELYFRNVSGLSNELQLSALFFFWFYNKYLLL